MAALIDLNNEDFLAVEREYCSRGLKYFSERAWAQVEPPSQIYRRGWATDAICDHLDAVNAGQITRLAMLVPPGLMKSLSTSVFFPASLWGPAGKPYSRILSASHSLSFAIRDNNKTRKLIESEWYQKLWPIKLQGDQNQKTHFSNEKLGFRKCLPYSRMTGDRGDYVLIDDPLTIEDGNPDKAALHTANRIFRETVQSRVNDPVLSAIILIMQVTGRGDVSFLAREMDYETLMLPMEFEPDRKCYTSIGFEDPRTEDKELLFPERFPPEVIEKEKVRLGSFGWNCQYQLNPGPRGGSVIRTEWLKYCGPILRGQMRYRIITADTAMKTGAQNDYSVFQLWGEGIDSKAYLIDQIRGKWEAPELERRAVAFWRKHHALEESIWGALRALYIEDKASGTGLIQSIKKQGVPVQGVQVVKDKYTRVTDILTYIEAGMVVISSDFPDLSDYLAELEAFTADNSHSNDDQVDPTVTAINKILVKMAGWWLTI